MPRHDHRIVQRDCGKRKRVLNQTPDPQVPPAVAGRGVDDNHGERRRGADVAHKPVVLLLLSCAFGGADGPDHHLARAGTSYSFDASHTLDGVAVVVVILQGAGHRFGKRRQITDLAKARALILVPNDQCHDRQCAYNTATAPSSGPAEWHTGSNQGCDSVREHAMGRIEGT